ncbi:hypothetical protein GWI33_003682 [Rhynchophorus ferrugineus]|uniref:Uncharacterized protein n=1 Tax=Rhynchophorus ferrugineus TaxID=354439 RepID=A0A834HKQ2_RHYFE|nr:hypothetical protein GWI33_003682 [Rhynchophorus ferrugineus]
MRSIKPYSNVIRTDGPIELDYDDIFVSLTKHGVGEGVDGMTRQEQEGAACSRQGGRRRKKFPHRPSSRVLCVPLVSEIFPSDRRLFYGLYHLFETETKEKTSKGPVKVAAAPGAMGLIMVWSGEGETGGSRSQF